MMRESHGDPASPPLDAACADASSASAHSPAVSAPPRRFVRHLAARIVYWTPVFAALALFAQVAFLGLRPAISEARRLADASDVLAARWQKDQQHYDAYELQLQAREDPIFRERQRRLRLATGSAGG